MAHDLFPKGDRVGWQPDFVLLCGLHAQGLDKRIISGGSMHEDGRVMRTKMSSVEMDETLYDV